MGLTVADTYFLKAKGAVDGFYCDWNEVCESLNYALSHNENHCAALCFLGKIYAEHFLDYEKSFECFDKVIAYDSMHLEVYSLYGKYLIWSDEVERAQKLILFAITLKGIDKSEMYWLLSYALETRGQYKLSLKMLKKAELENYNGNHTYFLKEERKRVKDKVRVVKKELDKAKTKKKST